MQVGEEVNDGRDSLDHKQNEETERKPSRRREI